MLDFDGPLVLCYEAQFVSWVNQQPSTKNTWNYDRLIATGDWAAVTGLDIGRITTLYRQFVQTPQFPGLMPTPGAAAVVASLPPHRLYLATARGHELSTETIKFVDTTYGRFNDHFFDVHAGKVALAARLEAQVVIDDCYPILCQIAQHTSARPILFPKQTPRNVSSDSGVTILDAEAQVYPGITKAGYHQVCRQAWQQIGDILAACSSTI